MSAGSPLPPPEVTTLPSGLRVASQAMPGVRTAAVGVWVHAGTRHEAADQNGISHFLEHMAFKGTERRSARELAEEVEAAGADINACTGYEDTAYDLRILPESLPLAVDVLADILLNPTFAEEELERERSVILQEIGAARDNPGDVAFVQFLASAFPDQPLGRPILGPPEIVSRLRPDELRAYMGRHYRGEAMVLAAAGAVDHKQLVELAGEAFAALGSAAPEPPEAARYRGGTGRVPRDIEQTRLVLGFEGVPHRDPDYYAMAMFASVLGEGIASRLFQEVREKRGLVYGIGSFSGSYADSGIFGVSAGMAERDAGEVIRRTVDEMHGVAKGIRPEELDRAKAQARSSLLMGIESCEGQAEGLARQLHIRGRPVSIDERLEKLAAVDREAVMRAAGRVLASPRTLAAVGPLGGLPEDGALDDLLGAPGT